jgi:low temperature requirement protein LtrA
VQAIRRLTEPPRLRTLADDSEDERHATWLELFFDLVFVVAVAQLGQQLSHDVTAAGFLSFLALFVPVWWAWMGFTFYANRFDTDDLPYRLLIFAAMLGVAALATTVPDTFEGASSGFVLAYVFVRVVLLVLYARAIKHVEQGRPIAVLYFTAFSAAVVVWLASLLLPEPQRYWLWALALVVEIGSPFVGWRLIPAAPVDPRHAPERIGLLTIIVLGESVFAVVLGVGDVSWGSETLLAALGGFVCAAAFWWIYFEFVDPEYLFAALNRRGRILRGLVFVYASFPVIAGLAALGVGVKLAILAAGSESGYDDSGWVLCAGLALAMAGLSAVELVTPPRWLAIDVWLRVGTAILALALIPLSSALSPLAIAWILAGALVVQVVVELAGHERHAEAL